MVSMQKLYSILDSCVECLSFVGVEIGFRTEDKHGIRSTLRYCKTPGIMVLIGANGVQGHPFSIGFRVQDFESGPIQCFEWLENRHGKRIIYAIENFWKQEFFVFYSHFPIQSFCMVVNALGTESLQQHWRKHSVSVLYLCDWWFTLSFGRFEPV